MYLSTDCSCWDSLITSCTDMLSHLRGSCFSVFSSRIAAWLEVHCLIVPSSAPVWKHLFLIYSGFSFFTRLYIHTHHTHKQMYVLRKSSIYAIETAFVSLSVSVVWLVCCSGHGPPYSAAIYIPGNNAEKWDYRSTAGSGDPLGQHTLTHLYVRGKHTLTHSHTHTLTHLYVRGKHTHSHTCT